MNVPYIHQDSDFESKIQQVLPQIDQLKRFIHRKVIGQNVLMDELLLALFCNGHVLLEGVPGLAKTLIIKTLSDGLSGKFSRIQFTPDLMPSDIIGTLIYDHSSNQFLTHKGPIFANFVLADEINRAPAKVQSALLEAMEEKQVSIGDHSFGLDAPFMVMATQNPLDQEGTYSLPEAQLDRFMVKILVNYPTPQEERKIIDLQFNKSLDDGTSFKPLSHNDLFNIQSCVRSVYMDDKIKDYIVRLIFTTRFPNDYGFSDFKPFIEYGVSPRGSIQLAMASKAYALLKGRSFVLPDDVHFVAKPVLRHRLGLSFEAQAQGMSADGLIQHLLNTVEVP